MTLATAKWTIADYHRMIAAGILDDRPVELIQGEMVEIAPEGESHAYCSDQAGDYLTHLLGKRVRVRQGKPITLPNTSEPEPDLAIVQPLGRDYLSHHPYPANIFWLIEYAESSLSKDLDIKRQIYAEANIPEYWIVNLQTGQLIIFRDPHHGDYESQITLTEGTIAPVAFPEVLVAVAAIVNL